MTISLDDLDPQGPIMLHSPMGIHLLRCSDCAEPWPTVEALRAAPEPAGVMWINAVVAMIANGLRMPPMKCATCEPEPEHKWCTCKACMGRVA